MILAAENVSMCEKIKSCFITQQASLFHVYQLVGERQMPATCQFIKFFKKGLSCGLF